MRDDHVLHELSAYLDGECPDPERVARHLDACPDCAARHRELEALSAGLRGLAPPEVHPAFVTRVLGAIEAPAAGPRRWRAFRLGGVFAAMAGLAVVVVGAFYLSGPTVPPGSTVGQAFPRSPVPSETLLLAELERRFREDEQADVWETAEEQAAWPDDGIGADDFSGHPQPDAFWLDALAEADWFEPMAAAFEAETDIESLLLALSEDESSALKELLSASLEQDWST